VGQTASWTPSSGLEVQLRHLTVAQHMPRRGGPFKPDTIGSSSPKPSLPRHSFTMPFTFLYHPPLFSAASSRPPRARSSRLPPSPRICKNVSPYAFLPHCPSACANDPRMGSGRPWILVETLVKTSLVGLMFMHGEAAAIVVVQGSHVTLHRSFPQHRDRYSSHTSAAG
jgi:hypothetical protein